MGSEIPIKIVCDLNCASNLYHKAYLALGGKASSKMSRSKLPTGQILAAAENLALDKTAQQVSANKNAAGQFLFYAEKLAFILSMNPDGDVINQIEPGQRIVYHESHGWKCV